jgi:hypothetical protein
MFYPSYVAKPSLTHLNRQETTADNKHNCCLHIKNASDAWWLTNPDITEEVCKKFEDDVSIPLSL